jgi:hypothetical protein
MESAMTDPVHPQEAANALSQIRDHQAKVVDVSDIPIWYWVFVGIFVLALAVATDTRRASVIGIAVPVFVLGVLATTAWLVRRNLHVQPRRNLIGPVGVLMILAFTGTTVGLSLGTAFTLQALGSKHPAVWGSAVTAVMLMVGGPLLSRGLRRRMLRNRDGAGR